MIVKLGKGLFWFGLILTVTALFAGFYLMLSGQSQEWAKLFLMLTPVGFLLLFTGLSTSILFGETDRFDDKQP